MRVLIIGYGSIGRRHDGVLQNLLHLDQIDIVTKQKLQNRNTFYALKEVKNINEYAYFIIASETNKHFDQLEYLENHLVNKIILCEKPLFQTYRSLSIKKNKVFVGYVLRFHPLLQKLQLLLAGEKALSINAQCGQYLPTWRPGVDYKSSYSANKDKGGGVLLDLSHEIDYIQWLFGQMREIKSYQLKISDLDINSDDMTTFIGRTYGNTMVNVSIDYISKISHRKALIHTTWNTYELDFIKNTLIQKDKQGLEQCYSFANMERNYMFAKMHQSILSDANSACTYEEGMETMKAISIIQEQSNT